MQPLWLIDPFFIINFHFEPLKVTHGYSSADAASIYVIVRQFVDPGQKLTAI